MKITTIGIDLAKHIFQVHCVDQYGKTRGRKQLKHTVISAYFTNLPPCMVGLEAYGSAHH